MYILISTQLINLVSRRKELFLLIVFKFLEEMDLTNIFMK